MSDLRPSATALTPRQWVAIRVPRVRRSLLRPGVRGGDHGRRFVIHSSWALKQTPGSSGPRLQRRELSSQHDICFFAPAIISMTSVFSLLPYWVALPRTHVATTCRPSPWRGVPERCFDRHPSTTALTPRQRVVIRVHRVRRPLLLPGMRGGDCCIRAAIFACRAPAGIDERGRRTPSARGQAGSSVVFIFFHFSQKR